MMNFAKDKVTAHLEKNVISNILSTARASLKEPSRPFTPGDTQRTLFPSSDLSRPPSAYSIRTFSKELEPLKQRPIILDVPIQTQRKVMSEDLKGIPRKPIKPVQEFTEDTLGPTDEELEVLNETKELMGELDRLRYDSQVRENYADDELDDFLESITNVCAEVKYLKNKPGWATCEEVLKMLALTLENFEKDPGKIMRVSKCLLDNLTSHDLLYKRNKAGVVASPLAMGAIKVLYQLSKTVENDILFIQLDIFDLMYSLLLSIVSEDSYEELDLPYDFLLFLFGILKNITNSSELVPVSYKLISPLASLLPSPFLDNSPHKNPKHSSLLVQVTGILSHISSEKAVDLFLSNQIIDKLGLSIRLYSDQDVVLNSLKTLVKISTVESVCKLLQNYVISLFSTLETYENPMIISRACYILANVLTTRQDSLTLSPYIHVLTNIASKYLNSLDPLHVDLLVKIVRLLVNLINAEDIRSAGNGENIVKFLLEILNVYSIEIHEELILNALACITNLLFYDLPGENFITVRSRFIAFSKISSILVQNFSEEFTAESLRALSNLTRHEEICKELPSLHIIEILILYLDHSYWGIIYYALGSLINVSSLTKEFLYSEKYFEILINLLGETEYVEVEFSKQLLMIFCNLCSLSKMLVPWESVAGEENVKTLSGLANRFYEKYKGNPNNLGEIAEGLMQFMPKPFVPCEFEGCGRKFPTAALLQEHWERRHS